MQRQDTTKLTHRIGRRIVNLRGDQTQEEFARQVGISRGYLSDIERGVREMSLETLARICHETKVSSNYILGL